MINSWNYRKKKNTDQMANERKKRTFKEERSRSFDTPQYCAIIDDARMRNNGIVCHWFKIFYYAFLFC